MAETETLEHASQTIKTSDRTPAMNESSFAPAADLPFVIRFRDVLKRLSEREIYEFLSGNESVQLEINAEGDLIVMPPTNMNTGKGNFNLAGQFFVWVERDGTGEGFDSSSMFTMPNGAKRSPDFCWIRRDRWERLSEEEKNIFSPICPDFVVELRSPSDSLKHLQAKMEEYIENGARLGWLIDPLKRRVHVYRPNTAVEILDNPETISGETVLPGFELKLEKIWK